MKSVQELGQFLKTQYPDGIASDGRPYAQIPDQEFGQMYVDKHPEYKNMVDDTASLGARISSDVGERGKVIQENKANADTTNPLDMFNKTLQNAGEVAAMPLDVGREVLKSLDRATGQVVSKSIEATGGLVPALNEPHIKEILSKVAPYIQSLIEKHPELAKDAEAILNIASLVPTVKAGSEIAKGGVDAIKTGVQAVRTAAAGGADMAANKEALKTASDAVRLTMRKPTKAEAAEGIAQGRLKEPSWLRPAALEPTPRDTLVGESVADVVNPKNNVSQNVDAISQKISQINSGVEQMIADRKTPFNMKQLRTKLMAGNEDLRLVFASDATAEKLYQRVVDAFMQNISKGDTLGLFRARQSFDKIPAVRKLLETEAKGENTRREIVLAVRRAANEYIAEQLPANNPYRSALMQETRMIEALNNLAENNASMLGKNKLQLLTERYPILKVIGAHAVGQRGVGAGGAVIWSTD